MRDGEQYGLGTTVALILGISTLVMLAVAMIVQIVATVARARGWAI